MELAAELAEYARRLGFDLVGVAPARVPHQDLQAYRDWLAQGYYGEMAYMARLDRVGRRENPSLILSAVRSVVSVAVNYCPDASPRQMGGPATITDDRLRGRISAYAWGADYHAWVLPRLEDLAAFIRARVSSQVRYRAYVDTGPVLERAFAVQAGLGFIGKNTCLINPRMGSWLLLGEILVDMYLPPTTGPGPAGCGTCTRCLQACPTGALVAPYRLDARRCISYLTIELKGPIPPALRPLLGNWIYGCDLCQEVCPWQRFARPTALPVFRASSPDWAAPSLPDLLTLDEEGFRRRFRDSPIRRIGRGRLLRNVAVALGNLGDPRAIPALSLALGDPDPLVREHAAWALQRLSEATRSRG